MNDRVVELLENYDFTVLRTWKGRGAIIFETSAGNKLIKEYTRPKEKLPLLEELLTKVERSGICRVDHYIKTKDGSYYVTDKDDVVYIVKDYCEGRECNVRDLEDLVSGTRLLAKLHQELHHLPQENEEVQWSSHIYTINDEFVKHNRELVRTLRCLNEKGQRSEFELFLLHNYKKLLEQAREVEKMAAETDFSSLYEDCVKSGNFIHGEYQYHNILLNDYQISLINFEKAVPDVGVKDLYYFLRKAMEKSGWSEKTGEMILEEYEKVRPLPEKERKQLYLRLLYPEKFWKIVNFYYNSTKSWIPGRNMEKLNLLLEQENAKQSFLNKHIFF